MEQRVKSDTVFAGRLLTLRIDDVELSDGRRSAREDVDHPGAVAIVPVTDAGGVLLVEHVRYAVERTLLELPAGVREPGESALQTAARELEEETGLRAATLTEIDRFFVSPGWTTEEIVLVRATGLTKSGHRIDHDEILDSIELAPQDVPVLMRDGTLADAKTIIGLLRTFTHLL